MLLLLLMYLAPFLAAALFWRAQSVATGAVADSATGDAAGETAWGALRSAIDGRTALVRPAAGAFLFGAVLAGCAIGMAGGVAYLSGALMAAFSAALVHAAVAASAERVAGTTTAGVWGDASAVAVAVAALGAGCVGALAWFFADPAGAVVLTAFVAGASAASLFLAMSLGSGTHAESLEPLVQSRAVAREAAAWSATATLHAHLAALAAALMVAATAEPESLLSLGGLLAETETLRSELLLLPIAITVLSPVLAVVAAPAISSLLQRGRKTALFDVERFAAALSGFAILAVVTLCGLAWAVAGAFAAGLAARQLAVAIDEAAERAHVSARRASPSMVPALLSGAALVIGDHLAGTYGVALAALGMTATFASASASVSARRILAFAPAGSAPNTDLEVADATATVASALALLVAAAPVLVAESARRGDALMLVATAAPALLIGAVVGAACAATASARYAEPDDEGDAVHMASRAVALATGLPVLLGLLLGGGAAVGIALGFTAWAAASTPLASGQVQSSARAPRLKRSALLAWGRTMALAALVGAPLMS